MSFEVLRMNYTQVHYQVRIKFKVINRETHALQVGHPIVICTPFPGLQYFTRLHYFMQFTITSPTYIISQIYKEHSLHLIEDVRLYGEKRNLYSGTASPTYIISQIYMAY
jgi:hypothetical protein